MQQRKRTGDRWAQGRSQRHTNSATRAIEGRHTWLQDAQPLAAEQGWLVTSAQAELEPPSETNHEQQSRSLGPELWVLMRSSLHYLPECGGNVLNQVGGVDPLSELSTDQFPVPGIVQKASHCCTHAKGVTNRKQQLCLPNGA